MDYRDIREGVVVTPRHVSSFLEAGPADGPAILFVHGWPELAISWRHQLPAMAALGFRAIAPDMRGYGRSSVYRRLEDYRLEESVRDMVELLDGLGVARAVVVGHDWGSPVAWSLARHHPDRVAAVASLCLPYDTIERGVDRLIELVDRRIYPAETLPAGQWDYMKFYEESFDRARRQWEGDVRAAVKIIFRAGDPAGRGQPSESAFLRRDNGWLAGAEVMPDVPLDPQVVGEAEVAAYTASLTRNGFFGPDAWYMNHAANAAYTASAPGTGRLEMPVLFLDAAYDYICETVDSRLAEPMLELCPDLTRHKVLSGHWMAQERPLEVNAALAKWLAARSGVWSFGY